MADSAGKICAKCGIDVSGSPRTKDKQGRYWCKQCFERAKAAAAKKKAAAAPAVLAQTDVMGQLVTDAVGELGDNCPECSNPMGPGAVLCTHCGYHLDRGKGMKTRVEAAPKEKKSKEGGKSFEISPNTMFAIIFILTASPGATIFFAPTFAIMAFVFSLLLALSVFVWVIVDWFIHAPVYRVLLLCLLPIPLVGALYHLYYVLSITQSQYLKSIYIGQLLGIITGFVLLIVGGGLAASTA